MLELLVSVSLLLVFAGATLSLYMANLKRYGSEQQTAEMNQTARNALELMSLEIQQAGSHPDASTTITAAVVAGSGPITMASTANFNVGDWVTIDVGTAAAEIFKLTAVDATTLSGTLTQSHAANAPVYLFARPYQYGIILPSGLGASSSTTTNTLKLFGDINNDGSLYYIEYTYNPVSLQILRSITSITNNNRAAATPIAENVANRSDTFTLYTDSQGLITKVLIKLTVNSTDRTQNNQITLSDSVMVRSVAAASGLLLDSQTYGIPNHLPPTPAKIVTWAN